MEMVSRNSQGPHLVIRWVSETLIQLIFQSIVRAVPRNDLCVQAQLSPRWPWHHCWF